MKQVVLSQFPWPWLPALGLLIFFGFFIVLLIRVSSRSMKPMYNAASTLPLEDGFEQSERRSGGRHE